MGTVDERLKHVTLKIKRAKEHIADVDRQLGAFYATNPYKVGVKRNPETRRPVYCVTSADTTPECLPLVAGDAIQNLMSALDHLAFQLVLSDTSDNPPDVRWIYFPVADTVEKYETLKRGKMKGARQETLDAIDALKPYRGGNDLLWMLYRLNTIEKHRLLLTVGSLAAGVHLGQIFARTFRNGPFPNEALAIFKSMEVYLNPADSGFPLKAGFELYEGAPDEEPDPNQQFRFSVALNEPGVAEGKPLLDTLHQLTTLVEGIVAALTPRLG